MERPLEGVLQYETKELLKYIVQERKLISLTFLNQQIQSFPYGYCDSPNKPMPVMPATMNSRDHSLKQTGMLMVDRLNMYTYT